PPDPERAQALLERSSLSLGQCADLRDRRRVPARQRDPHDLERAHPSLRITRALSSTALASSTAAAAFFGHVVAPPPTASRPLRTRPLGTGAGVRASIGAEDQGSGGMVPGSAPRKIIKGE